MPHPARLWAVVVAVAIAGCCHCPPAAPVAVLPTAAVVAQPVSPPPPTTAVIELPPPPPTGPGPTRMARVPAGYELANRSVRVVIDDQSGDVVEWAAAGQVRNTALGHRGIRPVAAGLADVPPVGTVEKRDEQTWQYVGADANGVTWRKVYNLDHDSLLVSYVIQNTRPAPLTTAVQVVGELIALRVTTHDPEQFTGVGVLGTVSLHGWDIAHGGPPPALPVLIQSDPFTLKPAERQGYTTEWRLTP